MWSFMRTIRHHNAEKEIWFETVFFACNKSHLCSRILQWALLPKLVTQDDLGHTWWPWLYIYIKKNQVISSIFRQSAQRQHRQTAGKWHAGTRSYPGPPMVEFRWQAEFVVRDAACTRICPRFTEATRTSYEIIRLSLIKRLSSH